MASVDLLAGELTKRPSPATDVELDLSDLEFIDIAGLRVFHQAAVELGRGRPHADARLSSPVGAEDARAARVERLASCA